MPNQQNKWNKPNAPPPPLYLNKKEKDFVKQIADEVAERVIGQQIIYYAIDRELTDFHPIYGEAINKTYYPPLRVYALVLFEGKEVKAEDYVDAMQSLEIYFLSRRLHEDYNLEVMVGDFVAYYQSYFEIVSLKEPKDLFGQANSRFEITAKCIRAREGLFNGT